MSFYRDLSSYYDEIFPADASEMAFVNLMLQDKTRLLDIGCGNGNKTELLAGADNEVTGIDADPSMIATARTQHWRPNIRYKVMGMGEIGSLKPAAYDGIVCLGNTLVHLDSHRTVQAFLHEAFARLSPGAVLIVQILHYEWIIGCHITSLPLRDTPHITFTRNYTWQNDVLHFRTTLLNKQTGAQYANDIVLLPLLTKDLAYMLTKAGFTAIQHFGGYPATPLETDSPASITICRKG